MSRRSPNTTADPLWARIVILALVAAERLDYFVRKCLDSGEVWGLA